MGGTVIGKTPVPFHQRYFVQGRGAFRLIGKKYPFPNPTLNPLVLQGVLRLEPVISRIEPAQYFERIRSRLIDFRIQRPLWIHIQHQRAKGRYRLAVQPTRQRR